jgi:hypothetical protein
MSYRKSETNDWDTLNSRTRAEAAYNHQQKRQKLPIP